MRCKTDDGGGVYLGDGISSRQFFRGEEGGGSLSLSLSLLLSTRIPRVRRERKREDERAPLRFLLN